ncbi:MAG: dienelactone hydrolase family protein [Rhodoferax sp.]
MFSLDQQKDFDALVPGRVRTNGANRRLALQVGLGLGYAAAAQPVIAQSAIQTSGDGLRTGTDHCTVAGFDVPLYYAAPQTAGSHPVVLVVHEIFGVHEYIADVCRRLAHAGYLAIAPELFARQGDARSYAQVGQLLAEVVSKVGDAQVMADLDAAVAWAADHGGDTTRLGINGFCWGGRIAWLYAAHRQGLRAAVAWYGRLVGGASALTPRQPLELAASLHAPVLGLYGGQDSGIGLDSIEQMKAALAAAGAQGNSAALAAQFIVYPEAPHAFHADYRASYRKDAAQDGFARALAWFKAKGVL